MNIWKKTGSAAMALLLTLILVISCGVAGAAKGNPASAAQGKSPSYNTYVVLGDSVATGYQQPGYVSGTSVRKVCWKLVDTAYPALVAKGVGAKTTYMMAKGGWRTTEMRTILDPCYPPDEMCRERLPLEDGSTWKYDTAAIRKLQRGYRANIRKADLITVQIGSNDVWQPIQVAKRNLDDPVYVAQLAGIEARSIATFKTNFDAIIRLLRAMNPHATIAVLGLYNPVANESLDLGPMNIPYGELLNDAIKVANAYMKDGCPYRGEYKYVNIMGIETLKSYPGTAGYVDDPHPTTRGHRQIAQRILKKV